MNFEMHNISIPAGATGEVRAVCPKCAHNRKPSHQREKDLAVNVDESTWLCHHCGWAGGLNKDRQAPIEYNAPSEIDLKVVEYFKKRGISKNTLEKFRIGYKPGIGNKPGAIMFPRFIGGECRAIKYRTHDKTMWQSKNPEPCFYNYDMANTCSSDTLIIVEGEIDAMSFYEAGFNNVVSVPDGAPPVASKNLDNKLRFLNYGIMEKFQSFILALDKDEPGQYLESEISERIGKHKCLMVSYPAECKDINDVLVRHGAEEVKKVIHEAKQYPIDGLYGASDMSVQISDFYEQGFKRGLSTGWVSLDGYYTIRPGEMTVVTGMPGSGKSTWLDALTVNLFEKYKWKTAFCSPENWPIKRHMASILEKLVRKPFDKATQTCSRMTYAECIDALGRIDGFFFFTEPPEKHMTINGILEIMQEAISRYGVNGIILDPWNELESHRPADKSETEYIGESLSKIRRFARTNNVHVWVVAHPTKMRRMDDGVYPVPRMYDINGSANWYNKTDNGICIHRPDINQAVVDVHIQKIRFREIGSLGNVRLKYVSDSGNYGAMSMDDCNRYDAQQRHDNDLF